MYKLFNTDELRKNGYIRYPRVFLDMLIRNCCKGKRIPTQIGIMLYLYSKVAYSPCQCPWKNDTYTIQNGKCIVKIPELATYLGCTVYAIRKGLEELEQSSVITKKKLDHGMAVEIINYQSFILNKTSYGK